jgi:hypothetical protein
MSDDTGGNGTSAVPVGTVGTSLVAGPEPGTATSACVVNTCAGAWMTPIVGGVLETGSESSSERENPYATSAPATATPAVTPMRVRRDRRFASLGSTTGSTTITTLSR